MAHFLLELYTPKPAWMELAEKDRLAYFNAIGSAMASLSTQGIEAITFGETDRTLAYTGPQQFFAVWKFPDDAALKVLIAGIAGSGWNDYFETVNIAGAGSSFADHLSQLTAL